MRACQTLNPVKCSVPINVKLIQYSSPRSAVQSVQLASACKSFEAGVDGWLSADSGVRVSRAGVV